MKTIDWFEKTTCRWCDQFTNKKTGRAEFHAIWAILASWLPRWFPLINQLWRYLKQVARCKPRMNDFSIMPKHHKHPWQINTLTFTSNVNLKLQGFWEDVLTWTTIYIESFWRSSARSSNPPQDKHQQQVGVLSANGSKIPNTQIQTHPII